MPLAPRLAATAQRMPGAPYHSTSRTGIEDATKSRSSGRSAAVRVRATPGSVGSS